MSEEARLVESIRKTQDLLGKYVKKPPLAEKLLKKPPFRFLHDVISTIIRDTGFLRGLFNENELNSANITDKEGKLAYLTKLIDAMKLITGQELSVRPSKIVSGQEPIKTNELLQMLARSIEKKISSSEAIEHYKKTLENKQKRSKKLEKSSEDKTRKSSGEKPRKSDEKLRKSDEKLRKPEEKTDRSREKPRTSSEKTGKSEEKSRKTSEQSGKSEEKLRKFREAEERRKSEKHSKKRDEILETKSNDQSGPKGQHSGVKTRNSGCDDLNFTREGLNLNSKVQTSVADVQNLEHDPQNSRPEGLKVRLNSLDSGETAPDSRKSDPIGSEKPQHELGVPEMGKIIPIADIVVPTRTFLRPPSARPPSGRPGAPKLKKGDLQVGSIGASQMGDIHVIVENFDTQDDIEGMVKVEVEGSDAPQPIGPSGLIGPELSKEHGYLVAQILETQRELVSEDVEIIPKVEIEWEAGAKRDREAVIREVEGLRSNIQELTRMTNPLGKLMDFLQEDVESMEKELWEWRGQYGDLREQLAAEKGHMWNALKPLEESLEEVESGIGGELEKIAQVKGNIMRNNGRIQKLLSGH